MKKNDYLIGAAIGLALAYAYIKSKESSGAVVVAPPYTPPAAPPPTKQPPVMLPNKKYDKMHPPAVGRRRRHIGVRPWDGPWGAARAMHV